MTTQGSAGGLRVSRGARAALVVAVGLGLLATPALGDRQQAVRAVPAPEPLATDRPLLPGDARPRIETQVAVHPANPEHVVVTAIQLSAPYANRLREEIDLEDRVWVSRDGAQTFDAGRPLPPINPATPAGNDPTLAWDPRPGGPLYASYTQFAGTSPGASTSPEGLYVARSDDGGRSWRRSRLVEGFDCSGPDRSQVLVDPHTGWVYVVWTHYVELPCNGATDSTQTQTRWARSTDGGRTFGRPVVVSTAGESIQINATVLRDGTLLTVHNVGGGALNDERDACPFSITAVVSRWTPSGRALGRTSAVVGCNLTGGFAPNGTAHIPIAYPAIAVDRASGTVVVAIPSEEAQGAGVAIGRSTDGGRTWSQQLVAGLPATSASMVSMAAGPRGRIAAAWLELDPGGLYRPVVAASPDAGISWSTPVVVATIPSVGNLRPGQPIDAYYFGHYMGVTVARDGTAYVVWPDLRPDAAPYEVEVWVRRVRLP